MTKDCLAVHIHNLIDENGLFQFDFVYDNITEVSFSFGKACCGDCSLIEHDIYAGGTNPPQIDLSGTNIVEYQGGVLEVNSDYLLHTDSINDPESSLQALNGIYKLKIVVSYTVNGKEFTFESNRIVWADCCMKKDIATLILDFKDEDIRTRILNLHEALRCAIQANLDCASCDLLEELCELINDLRCQCKLP